MIEIKNIFKKFRTNIVLKDCNMTVARGQLILIQGTNGCGKSTLLKLIAGLMSPNNGSIKIEDNVQIGALIENPSFIENETIAYNLSFLFNLNNKYDEKAVVLLCKQFDLDLYNKDKMKDYSVGMRQKTGIIQAIMEGQNLILLDEPTRGLDRKSIQTFASIINDLVSSNKSVIICAHDYISDLKYTEQYLLEDGKINEL